MNERFGLDVPPHERLPVAWYSPVGLRRVAREQLGAMNLLRHLDRRETFSGTLEMVDLRSLAEPGTDGEPGFWFDFLADTGDGGNASYTVARGALAAQVQAEGAEHLLPEARLLVLGGDLAYPSASPELYQSRLVEMFELARDRASRFADVPRDLAHDAPIAPSHKLVAAIPQNHDWFDSASTFCRYFVNDEKAGFVGARAPQRRTYFAFALPHDWFLLALDFALTGDLDRLQYEAFIDLMDRGALPEGANVVLVYPEPWWTRPLGADTRTAYPRRYQRLEHLLADRGRQVRLRLAGDLHHYTRERLDSAPPAGRSTDIVTCGSGGAFGHATHTREVTQPKVLQWGSDPAAAQAELAGRLLIGRVRDRAVAQDEGLLFDSAEAGATAGARTYPSQAESRSLAWGNLRALFRQRGAPPLQSNVAFTLALGSALALAVVATSRALPHGIDAPTLLNWVWALLHSPTALAANAALGFSALMVCTDNDPANAPRLERGCGVVLALLFLLAGWGLHRGLAPWVGGIDAPSSVWTWPLAWAACCTVVGLGFGAALLFMGLALGRILNNSSSALNLEDHKGFLRLRVNAKGLDAWMLGCDQVPRHWTPGKPNERPYWRPSSGQPALRWRVVDRFHIGR
ncbi:hypothetical protein BurJ1DRAFT_4484 [Burkholderiales bacterium JOSHI_001]|nr:hypothetical protein BurJ1DRAFT_4484 [Burkholderiales bacterium JOSHI_001]